jgi:hypothetical protein
MVEFETVSGIQRKENGRISPGEKRQLYLIVPRA